MVCQRERYIPSPEVGYQHLPMYEFFMFQIGQRRAELVAVHDERIET